MFKKVIHKGFSMLMAILVLCSTVSFTVEKHFCGDTLVDVAVFSKVRDCGPSLEQNIMTLDLKKPCCKNEVEVVKGQNDLKKTLFEDLNFGQQLFLTGFVQSYIHLFQGLPEQVIPHKDYSPPNLVLDIQVLDQVFII